MSSHSSRRANVIIYGTCTLLIIAGVLMQSRQQAARRSACQAPAGRHEFIIEAGQFVPNSLAVKRCDEITITNRDLQKYHFTFGVRDSHESYPGYTPETLSPNESLSFITFRAGEYTLHDHIRNDTTARLTITD